MTSFGKWAPLKLIAIVSLPHASPLVIEAHVQGGKSRLRDFLLAKA
jgi:hypothetical protein